MNKLQWKKRFFSGKNKWWLPGGLSPDDVICAYQFARVYSEEDALTNLNDPTKYTLEKLGFAGERLPVWTSAYGFQIIYGGGAYNKSYLYNEDLFVTSGEDVPSIEAKSIFACYAGNTQSASSIISFVHYNNLNRIDNYATLYARAMDSGSTSNDHENTYYDVPGMVLKNGRKDDWCCNITSDPKDTGVIGFSGNNFYIEGKQAELTPDQGGTVYANPGVTTPGIGNVSSSEHTTYYLKAIVVYSIELSPQQALAVSSAMRSFL